VSVNTISPVNSLNDFILLLVNKTVSFRFVLLEIATLNVSLEVAADCVSLNRSHDAKELANNRTIEISLTACFMTSEFINECIFKLQI